MCRCIVGQCAGNLDNMQGNCGAKCKEHVGHCAGDVWDNPLCKEMGDKALGTNMGQHAREV
jgi:hypothetical protein